MVQFASRLSESDAVIVLNPGTTFLEGPLRSLYSDDPDLMDIIALFIEELPARVAAIEAAYTMGDLVETSRLAHQLNGSSGGYGFPLLGEAAAAVEHHARLHDHESLEHAMAAFNRHTELIKGTSQ